VVVKFLKLFKMKKIFLALALVVILFTSCKETSNTEESTPVDSTAVESTTVEVQQTEVQVDSMSLTTQ
jgi:PBP1b-binding outer membrane lipoprotein LpoB